MKWIKPFYYKFADIGFMTADDFDYTIFVLKASILKMNRHRFASMEIRKRFGKLIIRKTCSGNPDDMDIDLISAGWTIDHYDTDTDYYYRIYKRIGGNKFKRLVKWILN